MITICTCWYNIKSKFNISVYHTWMKNLINNVNNFNLVIYTNKESYYVIEPLVKEKKNKQIKIIFKEWKDFYCYKWNENWIENHKLNNSLNHNSIFNTDCKLNMLWSEKINFVKEVYEKKIFDTKYYGWCDIGYFRGGNNLTNEQILNWPNNKKINELPIDKILYGLAGNRNDLNILSRIVLSKGPNNMPITPIPPSQVSIAGGFFVTYHDNINWWHKTYYNRLNDYFKYKYLVKDDQIIIIDCIINNFKKFKIVEEIDPKKDRWFVFQNYFM